METKSKKAASPSGKAGKTPPAKPVKKKRRWRLWLFLFFLLGSMAATAGVYYRWIAVAPDMMAKIEPYMAKADPYLAKVGIARKPAEESGSVEKPQTNFPLVELDGDKKNAETKPAAATPPDNAGKPSVASASPAQPANGSVKPPVKETADTAKIYGRLAKLYGAMKPEEAAAVFNNLEDEQVVLILSRMEEESAAKVLSTLEPKKAARLTQAMIKRK